MAETTQQGSGPRKNTEMPRGAVGPTDELVALCPSCKAFETLWFTGDTLVQTRKYAQRGTRVYHDCGTDEPCQLLMRFLKQK